MAINSVDEWWGEVIHKRGDKRKATTTLAMLVSWEVWNERNARVFGNKATTSIMLIEKIKEEATIWCLAGAKALSSIVPRE